MTIRSCSLGLAGPRRIVHGIARRTNSGTTPAPRRGRGQKALCSAASRGGSDEIKRRATPPTQRSSGSAIPRHLTSLKGPSRFRVGARLQHARTVAPSDRVGKHLAVKLAGWPVGSGCSTVRPSSDAASFHLRPSDPSVRWSRRLAPAGRSRSVHRCTLNPAANEIRSSTAVTLSRKHSPPLGSPIVIYPP
jgi:hypothetical protein